MHGAVNGDYSALGYPGQYAVVAPEDFLDVGIADHTKANQIADRAELGR